MRDHVHRALVLVLAWPGFHRRGPQPGAGVLFGGVGQIDNGHSGFLVRQFDRFPPGRLGPGQKNSARPLEALRIETADERRFVSHLGQLARFLLFAGDEAQVEFGCGARHDIPDFPAEQ